MTTITTIRDAVAAAHACGAYRGVAPELILSAPPDVFSDACATWPAKPYRYRAVAADGVGVYEMRALDAHGVTLRISTVRAPTENEAAAMRAWALQPNAELPAVEEAT